MASVFRKVGGNQTSTQRTCMLACGIIQWNDTGAQTEDMVMLKKVHLTSKAIR